MLLYPPTHTRFRNKMSNKNQELPGMLELENAVRNGIWPHTIDARAWVDKWLEIIKNKPEIATDYGTMLSWFANAIMAGYDAAIFGANQI